jgi:hypothetical protein
MSRQLVGAWYTTPGAKRDRRDAPGRGLSGAEIALVKAWIKSGMQP